jgi:hypothetical protein
MSKPYYQSLSLEQLEGSWGNPDTAPTSLVRRCITASKVALRDLTTEQLRLLIGQKFSLSYLVPLALPLLEICPLLAGDLYEGDLLNNMLALDWQEPTISEYLPRVVDVAKAAHLQMMSDAIEDLLHGCTPEELGLSEDALKSIRRRAIETITIAPWNELMEFLETHG